MITREEFVEIINRLKETDNLVKDINNKMRNFTEAHISDFTNAGSLMICHEDVVVDLLENMFNDTNTISWWLYEKDYGRNPELKMWDEFDNEIDVSTSERLYDFLVENLERKKIDIKTKQKIQKNFSQKIFERNFLNVKTCAKVQKIA